MKHKINIQAAKLKTLTVALHLAIIGLTLHGQPQMKIDDGRYCEGHEVLLPVLVDGFDQISSFTLYLGFNPQVVNFIELEERHEQFNSGSLMSTFHPNNGDPLLIITWVESNNNPATVPSGALFHMRFTYADGESLVFFKTGCEISIGMSPVAEASFLDGSVAPVEITLHPQDQFVAQDQQAAFTVQVNGDAQYQWLMNDGENWFTLADDDHYIGATGGELLINNVPKDFHNHLYRCEVTVGDCSFLSEIAMLIVSSLSTDELQANSGFMVYPNPFNDELNIWLHENGAHLSGWRLLAMYGDMIVDRRAVSVNDKVCITGLSGLSSGVYFLQVFNDGLLVRTIKLLKH
jgi:hypothetical protein